MPGSATSVRARRARRVAGAYLGITVVLSAAYLGAGTAAKSCIFVLIAGGTTVALATAPRRSGGNGRPVWYPLAAACSLFAVGAVLRTVTAADANIPGVSADVATLLGYFLLGVSLVRLMRVRDAGRDSGTLVDAFLVGLAGAVAGWNFLVVPTLANPALGHGVEHLISAVYPPIDALLIVFAVSIALAAQRTVCVRLLLAMFVTMLVGDLGYATTLAGLLHVHGPLLDTPYLLSYGALGTAALHPSFRELTAPQPVVVRPLQYARLVTVLFALAMPSVVVLVRPPVDMRDRIVLAVGSVMLVVAVLRRAADAVRAHARSEAALAQRATTDTLTGLSNRGHLLERLGDDVTRIRASGEDLVVLLVDLDRFKVVNDCYGHPAGDELLQAVAGRLSALLGPDDYVARTGGDEFVVVVRGRGTSPTEFAERVHDVLNPAFDLGIGDIVVSASIGVSVADADRDVTPQTLVRDADTAMYHAKDAGRGLTVVFDSEMHAAVSRRLQVEQALHRALARDDGFEVHYQPIVALDTGTIEGFEALIRMPGSGLRPDEFIPVAEDTGLIGQIGARVLRDSAAAVAQWRANGASDVFVAVNVSARQLSNPTLADSVIKLLETHGLPSSALHLEVTESSLMDDVDAAQRTLTALSAAGFSIAVDDFGTGYSSLAYLRRFPVATVKVDRSFVQGIGAMPTDLSTSSDDGALVRAIVAMAHALGMSVVAEGVETRAQQQRLISFGCEQGQGWLFGKPVPLADASALITPAADPAIAAG